MDPFDPVLDRPETIEIEAAGDAALYWLANQDVVIAADVQANLRRLFWPWADADYAQQIDVRITDPHDDAFMPMVTQRYPGHLETICGSEGMVVSKRLLAPYKSHYDRAVMWLLDCEAEGDRLLRIDVEIDWGEPLTQRMVDGLLVAQRNPLGARGVYDQHNAESTRVFGNPQGRPSQVDLDDPQRAHLVYYVLVNGMVEVSMLLTISDVGEQMAWSGFLALRDSGIVFRKSTRAWEDTLRRGRLWTPDPRYNRAVQRGHILAAYHLQRLRTGLAPTDRRVEHIPALVAAHDTFDIIQSRNLLAHLRRLAEKHAGRLPEIIPLRAKDSVVLPGAVAVLQTGGAYLRALQSHLRHHPDAELLAQHAPAVAAVSEQLIQARVRLGGAPSQTDAAQLRLALQAAAWLAALMGDDVNLARWRSEAEAVLPGAPTAHQTEGAPELPQHWELRDNGSHLSEEPWHEIDFAAQAVWRGCGLEWRDGQLHVAPRWPAAWSWWALLALPYGRDQSISLVWDGVVLHVDQAVVTELPTTTHAQIQLLNSGEYDFNLTFRFIDDLTGEAYFRPEFLTA